MGKIVHIVLWKLKRPSTSTGSTGDVFASAKEAINALKTVPGAEYMSLGAPVKSERSQGYDYGLYSIFSSRAALETYAVSEAHVKVVKENVAPNTEGILAYDFELED